MRMRGLMAVMAAFLATGALADVPWKSPEYTLVARAMPLREALESFGVAQGMSVVMTKYVAGTLSGDFKRLAPQEFLDRIATIHNLMWYYDGAALYVYGSSEIVSSLFDLRFMKAEEVRAMLRELGLEDERYPIRTAQDGEMMLVAGPPRYVVLIGEMIARADRLKELRTFNEVEARVFPLVNTWADDVTLRVTGPESQVQIRGVAQTLEEIMRASVGPKSRDTVSSNQVTGVESQLADSMAGSTQPVIRPDNRLNAVIVRDVKSRMPMYERLIAELDKPQKIVEIDVTAFEMSRNDALDWQLSLKLQGSQDDVDGAVGMNARNLFTPAALAGGGLAGAASYLGKDVSVYASLEAMKTKGKARNVSRTALVTINNMSAELTDTQSYHAKVVGREVASLEEVTAGTKLAVKPRIVEPPAALTNLARQVWLTMELEDGGFESVTVEEMPMTRQTTLETQAAVFEDDSILLGGYFRDIKEEAGWGIPYLRDIPFIGWIFGGVSYKDQTVQRLFILTPRVIDFGYYHATTQSLVRVQTLGQRDMRAAEELRDAIERDDAARKDREEAIDERNTIIEEQDEERLRRNRKEREFRKEMRHDAQEKDAEGWNKLFKERKEAYERSRDEEKEKAKDAK